MNRKRTVMALGVFMLLLSLLVACGQASDTGESSDNNASSDAENEANGELSGTIIVNGSSTVYPVGIIAAEEFMAANPGVNVTMGDAGSGAGFEMYAAGEVDFSQASRAIKPEEEEAIKEAGMTPVEYTLGYDGITVLVHADNDFVDYLTLEELKKIWEKDSQVKKWSDIRAEWPDEEIVLYAPGSEHGTYDFFVEAVIGDEDGAALRDDYTANAYNMLVQGIAGDKNSLGFLGYSYYIENEDILKAVPIDSGNGPIEPTIDTISDGTYAALARPLFIYPNSETMQEKPVVKEFVKFYLENAKSYVEQAGYAPLDDAHYEQLMEQFEENHGDN